MRRAHAAGLLIATCVAASVAAPAWAGSGVDTPADGDDAEALIARGVLLREQGRDREALELFERAESRQATPRGAAQVALAQQALGRWVEAEAGLVRALSATADPWIARNRAALEQALDTVRAQLAWIDVDASVPGAQVRVAGELAGTAPLHGVRVEAGVVLVEVRAPGYEPAVRRVQVRAGERAHESLALTAVEPPRPLAPGPSVESVPSTSSSGMRTAAWITLGAGVALVAGGVAAHVVREHDAAIWNDPAQCLAPGQTREQLCGSYLTGANTATALAVAGYATGGAALAAAAYLFWRSSVSAAPTHAGALASARCGVLPGGVTCGLAF